MVLACSSLWWLWFAGYDSKSWLHHYDMTWLLYDLYTTYDKDNMATRRWRWLGLFPTPIDLSRKKLPGPHSAKAWQPTVAGAAWYKRFGQFRHRRSVLTLMINWNWPFSTPRTSHIFDIFDRFRLFGMEHREESGLNYVRWSRGTMLGRTFMFRLVRRNPTLEQISKHLWFYQNQDKTIDCPWVLYYLLSWNSMLKL